MKSAYPAVAVINGHQNNCHQRSGRRRKRKTRDGGGGGVTANVGGGGGVECTFVRLSDKFGVVQGGGKPNRSSIAAAR